MLENSFSRTKIKLVQGVKQAGTGELEPTQHDPRLRSHGKTEAGQWLQSLTILSTSCVRQMNFEKKPEENERTHRTHDKWAATICVLRLYSIQERKKTVILEDIVIAITL